MDPNVPFIDAGKHIRKDRTCAHLMAASVLIATNAARMGVNYVGVHRLINFGPPKDMNTFAQQIGRAGRDGLQSEAVLVYNIQLCYVDEEMKDYVKNEA